MGKSYTWSGPPIGPQKHPVVFWRQPNPPKTSEWHADQLSAQTQFIQAARKNFSVCAGYRKARELDSQSGVETDFGQDQADLKNDDRYVVGVVTDGVSQSFMGDIAAREISPKFLNYLWENRQNPPAPEQAKDFLNGLVPDINKKVEDYDLSSFSGLIRGELEKKKQEGTQAVISAFVYDTKTKESCIFQIGDAPVVVHFDNEQSTEKVMGYDRGRWSSQYGVQKTGVRVTKLTNVKAVIAQSDGPNKIGPEIGLISLDDLKEKECSRILAEAAGKDDACFVAAVSIPSPS